MFLAIDASKTGWYLDIEKNRKSDYFPIDNTERVGIIPHVHQRGVALESHPYAPEPSHPVCSVAGVRYDVGQGGSIGGSSPASAGGFASLLSARHHTDGHFSFIAPGAVAHA